jgi:hypothetical protein
MAIGRCWADGVWAEAAWNSAIWKNNDPANYSTWGAPEDFPDYIDPSTQNVTVDWARAFGGVFSIGRDDATLVAIETWRFKKDGNPVGGPGQLDGDPRWALYAGGNSATDMTGAVLLEDFGQVTVPYHPSSSFSSSGLTELYQTWMRLPSLTKPSLPDNTRLWIALKQNNDGFIPEFKTAASSVAAGQGDFDATGRVQLSGNTNTNDQQLAWPDPMDGTSSTSVFYYPVRIVYEVPVTATEDPITSIDSSSLAVVTISNTLSTDETNALKIDVSQLEPEPGTGRPVREVYIERIKAITSGVDVDILWDATSPEHCLSLSGNSGIDWDFRAVGPLTNNAGAGKTGNILFSTNGATAGSSYSVTLAMRKKY